MMKEYFNLVLKIIGILSPLLLWVSVKLGWDIEMVTNIATVVLLVLAIFLKTPMQVLSDFLEKMEAKNSVGKTEEKDKTFFE